MSIAASGIYVALGRPQLLAGSYPHLHDRGCIYTFIIQRFEAQPDVITGSLA
jgi:hypothetical protein